MRRLAALSLALLPAACDVPEPEPPAPPWRPALSENGSLEFRLVDGTGRPIVGFSGYASHDLPASAGPADWCGVPKLSLRVQQARVPIRSDEEGRVVLALAEAWSTNPSARGLSSVLWIRDHPDATRADLGAVELIHALDGKVARDLGDVVLRPKRVLAAGRVDGLRGGRSATALLELDQPLVLFSGAERPDPRVSAMLPLGGQSLLGPWESSFRIEGWAPGELLHLALYDDTSESLTLAGPFSVGSDDLLLRP